MTAKSSSVRAEVYQKLHEFNLHIDQGMVTLRSMSDVKHVSAEELERMADYFEELRNSSNGYISSIISDEELSEAGRLFARRRRREMAEDPMHGGWLEEEREKKRLKELRESERSRKKSRRNTNRG